MDATVLHEKKEEARWKRHLGTIQSFHSQQSLFETFCRDVTFVCKKRLREANIETSGVIWRVKSLASFLEKIDRKPVRKPLEEITDICGVRIVFLHKMDAKGIRNMIRDNFVVVEEKGKRSDEPDRFGYSAQHFLIRLREENTGARYEDLRNFTCEIQVRTVLQDAWAILDHHLRYKHESEIPQELRRAIHGLAGALETADDRFSEIAKKRSQYIKRLQSRRTLSRTLLAEPINRDSLGVFLQRKFPEFVIQGKEDHFDIVMASIDPSKFSTIRDLNKALDETTEERRHYADVELQQVALAHVALAIACKDDQYRQKTYLGERARSVVTLYCRRIHGPQFEPVFALKASENLSPDSVL